jgi:hypothetical protein
MGMGPGWAASGCADVLLPTWRMALVSWVSNVARVEPVRSAGARPLASWAVSWSCRPRQHDDFLPARDFGAVRQGGGRRCRSSMGPAAFETRRQIAVGSRSHHPRPRSVFVLTKQGQIDFREVRNLTVVPRRQRLVPRGGSLYSDHVVSLGNRECAVCK